MSLPPTITDRQRSYTLFVLVLVFTSSHIDRQIMGILGQPIKESLQISDTQLGLLTGIMFAFFYATLGMPMAMWADRGNRRNIITLSVAVWSAMTALCGMANTFGQLLLTRIGVGIGEAGSNPPSHSIIADLYPPERRATAMAIFATGVNLGIMLGYLIGGWVNVYLDWRWAFVVVGLPGLLIAALVRFTIKEPPRGYAEAHLKVEPPPPFWYVVRYMAANATIRNLVLAGTLSAFAGYAGVIWVPVYLARLHELNTGEVGTVLALMVGLGGLVGTFGAGWLADRVAKYGEGWRAWIVAISLVITLPFAAIAYLSTDTTIAIVAYIIPALLGGAYIGVGFAILQSLIPVEMRSVAAAINLFIVNIIGLGVGPFSVGLISDLTAPTYGADSLRYGLLAMLVIGLWAAWHYIRVGQLLQHPADGKTLTNSPG